MACQRGVSIGCVHALHLDDEDYVESKASIFLLLLWLKKTLQTCTTVENHGLSMTGSTNLNILTLHKLNCPRSPLHLTHLSVSLRQPVSQPEAGSTQVYAVTC